MDNGDEHKILWVRVGTSSGMLGEIVYAATERESPVKSVDQRQGADYKDGMNFDTWLFTKLRGRLVGEDSAGNRYYEDRKKRPDQPRRRRWVAYKGAPEATKVPPEWHAWLHFITDEPLPMTHKPWVRPHRPNLTGTPLSYRPPGHDYSGGQRARSSGDYEAWTPGS
ncbi:NADH:ubiquinone oxidoreductase 17.2 kD subunit [Granulibacter bethesdensis]|nr:NADH:ubiquinone oxidoreductase 17.2 kD subunit [Granulibacter bethesdensis]